MEVLIDGVNYSRALNPFTPDPKEQFYSGDVRSCGYATCGLRVIYSGNGGWSHMPVSADELALLFTGYVAHSARPFQDHKHKLKLLAHTSFIYVCRCEVCGFKFDYNRNMIHRMLLKEKESSGNSD